MVDITTHLGDQIAQNPAAILKIRKITTELPILTKFGTVMRLCPPDTVSQYNFANTTTQDGGVILKNQKNLNIFATD